MRCWRWDSPFVAFVALCAFGGLLLGEADRHPTPIDVDFLKREIHVPPAVQRAGGITRWRSGHPSTGSERTVYAPDLLLAVLAEHIRAYRPGDDLDPLAVSRPTAPTR